MRKIILSILFVALITLAVSEANAQTTMTRDNSCNTSAKEILSLVKSVYNLSPINEGLLVAGEIRAGNLIMNDVPPLSMFRVVTGVGGVFKSASNSVYIIKQSPEGKESSLLEVDIRDIKDGRAKDVLLRKGDTVFVSRGCSDGKLLPPTKPVFMQVPRLTDSPIRLVNKPISK